MILAKRRQLAVLASANLSRAGVARPRIASDRPIRIGGSTCSVSKGDEVPGWAETLGATPRSSGSSAHARASSQRDSYEVLMGSPA